MANYTQVYSNWSYVFWKVDSALDMTGKICTRLLASPNRATAVKCKLQKK